MRLRRIIKRNIKGKKRAKYKRKCFFDKYKIEHIDYKNTLILNFFLNNRKKILPQKFAHTSAKNQRKLKKAIKLARIMGLISYRNLLQK